MSENYVPQQDFKALKIKLLGDDPPRFEGDVGIIGKHGDRLESVEKAVDNMPQLVKKEINAAFTNWRGLTLFGVSLGTFIVLVYKTFVAG